MFSSLIASGVSGGSPLLYINFIAQCLCKYSTIPVHPLQLISLTPRSHHRIPSPWTGTRKLWPDFAVNCADLVTGCLTSLVPLYHETSGERSTERLQIRWYRCTLIQSCNCLIIFREWNVTLHDKLKGMAYSSEAASRLGERPSRSVCMGNNPRALGEIKPCMWPLSPRMRPSLQPTMAMRKQEAVSNRYANLK